MAVSLPNILRFTELLNQFQSVERVVSIAGGKRRENDVEHSYTLALLAWYIVDSEKLPLDLHKVLRYALIHDFVEVYAGDTYLYSKDIEHLASKETREKQAQEKLKETLTEFPDLHQTISAYASHEDRESRFVYVLDKMEPVIKIYLNNGKDWRENGVTLAQLLSKKQDKAKLSPELTEAFDELVVLLAENEERLFPRKELQ